MKYYNSFDDQHQSSVTYRWHNKLMSFAASKIKAKQKRCKLNEINVNARCSLIHSIANSKLKIKVNIIYTEFYGQIMFFSFCLVQSTSLGHSTASWPKQCDCQVIFKIIISYY